MVRPVSAVAPSTADNATTCSPDSCHLAAMGSGGLRLRSLRAGNPAAEVVVSGVRETMGELPCSDLLLTVTCGDGGVASANAPALDGTDDARGDVELHLPSVPDAASLLDAMVVTAQSLLREHIRHGSMLLHGGLLVRGTVGVIAAGPGGVGKTTMCGRALPPWEAWSDDAALVHPGGSEGNLYASPWPTWSRLAQGRRSCWRLDSVAELNGVVFLRQAAVDAIAPVKPAAAVCMLLQNVEQAWRRPTHMVSLSDLQQIRRYWFDNVCALVQRVPCFVLDVSRAGPDWAFLDNLCDGRYRENP